MPYRIDLKRRCNGRDVTVSLGASLLGTPRVRASGPLGVHPFVSASSSRRDGSFTHIESLHRQRCSTSYRFAGGLWWSQVLADVSARAASNGGRRHSACDLRPVESLYFELPMAGVNVLCRPALSHALPAGRALTALLRWADRGQTTCTPGWLLFSDGAYRRTVHAIAPA